MDMKTSRTKKMGTMFWHENSGIYVLRNNPTWREVRTQSDPGSDTKSGGDIGQVSRRWSGLSLVDTFSSPKTLEKLSQLSTIFTTQVFIAIIITTQVHSIGSWFHVFLGLKKCQTMRDLLYTSPPPKTKGVRKQWDSCLNTKTGAYVFGFFNIHVLFFQHMCFVFTYVFCFINT